MEDLFTFSWTIENFSMCHQRVSEHIKSPIFIIEMMNNITGYILVYPRGKIDNDYISCDCYTEGFHKFKVPLLVSISLTSNSDLGRKQIGKFSFTKGDCLANIICKRKEIFGERNKYLSEDLLTVELRIKRLNSNSSSSIAYSAKTIAQVEQHRFSVPRYMLLKTGALKETETYSIIIPFNQQLKKLDRVFEIIFRFSELSTTKEKIEIEVRRILGDTNVALFSKCQVALRGSRGLLNCLVEGEQFFQDNTIWTLSCTIGSEEEKWLVQNPNSLTCYFNESDGTMLTTLQKCQFPSQHQNQKGILQAEAKCTNFVIKLYNDKDSSDVVLQVKERVFPAHVKVLGVASLVFKAMFANDMKEKKNKYRNHRRLRRGYSRKNAIYIFWGY